MSRSRPPANPLRALATTLLLAAFLSAPAMAQNEVSRGAYLAKVTGCEGCHSAHDAEGHVLPGRLMAGGDHPIRAGGGPGLVPPNITPDRDTGIGGWDVPAIAAAIRTGQTPDGRILSLAMPWRTQFAALTEADAQAIAAYLLTVPPVHRTGGEADAAH